MRTPDNHKIETAIVSVSDKSGLAEFCRELTDLGIKIYSTGGTLNLLKTENIPAESISALTGFPEIMDGRVKTLHPAVHGGLLADLGEAQHSRQLEEHNLRSIDLLVVNLYPFEQTLAKNAPHYEMIENIDIGGPAMLRSAGKNYKWTAPVTNPARYSEIVEMLKSRNCTLPEDYRLKLAGEVFSHTAYYDSLIAGYFNKLNGIGLPEASAFPLKIAQGLRYGENPHQNAALYGSFLEIFSKLHGKELSYNNILDIDAAARLIGEFDKPACAIIKHTNPCGAAVAENICDAYNLAFETDKVSPFGGIIAFNRTIDLKTAEAVHSLFTELIIAPDFEDGAMELLTKKKDRRLIKADFASVKSSLGYDYRSVAAGFLAQKADSVLFEKADFKVVTKRSPTVDEMNALLFAWIIVKHVKSNAIVYAAKDRTLAIGAGQMSRVDSSRIAVEKAKLSGLSLIGSVMASDAFFPFADGLLEAASAGATAVIQPGGSVRDNEVIAAADERNIAMIFTGMRHFRH